MHRSPSVSRLALARTLVSVLACLLALPASARAGEVPNADPWIGAMPSEGIEFAIELNPAARVLDSRFVRWIAEQPDVAPSASVLAESWAALADALSYSTDEARARLLHSRLMLIAGDQGWAVRVDLEPDAAARIRQRLRPVPRKRILNRPVVSFDRGALQAVLLVEPGEDRSLSLVISPPEHDALLETMIRAAEVPGEPAISGTRGWAETARLADAEEAGDAATVRVWWTAEGRQLSIITHLDDERAWAGASFEPTPRVVRPDPHAGFEASLLRTLDSPRAAMIVLADRAVLESDDTISPLLGPLSEVADEGHRKMAVVVRENVRCEALSGIGDAATLDEMMARVAPNAGRSQLAGRFPNATRSVPLPGEGQDLTWRWSGGWALASVGPSKEPLVDLALIHPAATPADGAVNLDEPGPIAFALVLRPELAGTDPAWADRFAGVIREATVIATRRPDHGDRRGLLVLEARVRFEQAEEPAQR
ncbi:MAG: hypothetical protein AAGG07_11150 [Planctomycetota bacterium]